MRRREREAGKLRKKNLSAGLPGKSKKQYVITSPKFIWKFEVWLRKPNPYAQRDISEPREPRVIPTAEESHAKRVEIFSCLKLEREEFDLI